MTLIEEEFEIAAVRYKWCFFGGQWVSKIVQ
jgi:hypothetical protein